MADSKINCLSLIEEGLIGNAATNYVTVLRVYRCNGIKMLYCNLSMSAQDALPLNEFTTVGNLPIGYRPAIGVRYVNSFLDPDTKQLKHQIQLVINESGSIQLYNYVEGKASITFTVTYI